MISFALCQERQCFAFAEPNNDLCGYHAEKEDDGKRINRRPKRGDHNEWARNTRRRQVSADLADSEPSEPVTT